MTIKEMEARTGLTRANIRFYEAEGLITPERRPNGYRDYSEEDMAVLQRVKLLRSLHMSLEEIKAIHAGDHSLSQALDRHLVKLEQDQADLERSKTICQSMQGDGVRYETLDAPRYLEELERAAQGPPAEFASDQLPRVKAPWRRYFARSFDLFLYASLLDPILILQGVNISNVGSGLDLLYMVVSLLLMYLLEPIFLSKWGSTPGKAILGLWVTDLDGERMTLSDARSRTAGVLWRGMGLTIPIYEWVRNYKSYTACEEGKVLDWETDSLLALKDTKVWRPVLLVVLVLGVTFGTVGLNNLMAPPHNTGDITVAEFCENFNEVADYADVNLDYTLDAQGNWVEVPREDNVIVLWPDTVTSLPTFTFREEDGVLTGLTYTIEGEQGGIILAPYNDHIILALMAFVSAQEDYRPGLFSSPLEPVLEALSDFMPRMNTTLFGVRITCVTDWPPEGDYAKIEFSMDKVE
ncbi:MAG: MerR family transcriptional regulator [Ruminiclostridium sp.]|nr:MerR family transcriptional regulator [Ruminiclostridium sp.]